MYIRTIIEGKEETYNLNLSHCRLVLNINKNSNKLYEFNIKFISHIGINIENPYDIDHILISKTIESSNKEELIKQKQIEWTETISHRKREIESLKQDTNEILNKLSDLDVTEKEINDLTLDLTLIPFQILNHSTEIKRIESNISTIKYTEEIKEYYFNLQCGIAKYINCDPDTYPFSILWWIDETPKNKPELLAINNIKSTEHITEIKYQCS